MTADDSTVTFTLQGSDLSWLDLMLLGAVTPRYEAPDPPELAATAPSLVVPQDVAVAARDAGQLSLLDPEGVTLARVTVEDHHVGAPSWLVGPIAVATGFHHLDELDLRRSPAETAESWPSGSVVALWADAPVPFTLRMAARDLARSQGGSVLEVVPVPSRQETSLAAHLAPRLARLEDTRAERDQAVVVPAPPLDWTANDLLARAAIVGRYGATMLAISPHVLDALGDQRGAVEAAAAQLGVAVHGLSVPPDQTGLDRHALYELIGRGEALPTWYAEPAVADEIHRLVRPPAQAGFTVLLSGLSGSGKSTVARALAVRLLETESRAVSLLDGDVVRHHLSKGLGFAKDDRDTNVRRIGFVASEITKAGGIAICCPIAPYDATRRDVRAMVEEQGGFLLVHVATPLAECELRDRKGLYAKARRGEIPEFTGISDPYEAPTDAEVVIDTTGRTIDSCVDDVIAGLRTAGFIPTTP